jgi:AcrR family transcriptional regulator
MTKARLPGPERRRQIMAVSRAVLAEHGYHNTTMAAIADAAGVTKPVLYKHFESKRELYSVVLTDIGARLESAVVEAAGAASTPREQAEAGIRAFSKFVAEDEQGFELLFSGVNRQDAEWVQIIAGVERSLADAIAAMIDVPSIEHDRRQVLAYGVIGLAESMMRVAGKRHEGYGREQLVADLTDLVWSGLRGLGVRPTNLGDDGPVVDVVTATRAGDRDE